MTTEPVAAPSAWLRELARLLVAAELDKKRAAPVAETPGTARPMEAPASARRSTP